MGVWKAEVSFRIGHDLRRELQGIAEQERRTLGNVGAVLIEWAVAQFHYAGSIDRLLKIQLSSKKEEQ
jgi:hypothetical protein